MEVEETTVESPTDSQGEPTPRRARRWVRPAGLAGAGIVLLAGIGVLAAGRDDASDPSVPQVDVWVPYWALDDVAPGIATIVPELRELSPFWFATAGIDSIGPDANVSAAGSARVVDAARVAGVAVVPSIRDAMPAGGMAAVLADPTTRTRHVDALVGFATAGSYTGLDLDYEQFAFADPRETWAATSASWIAFLRELAGRLHADGRTLTVSVPPIYDGGRTPESGYWVYDYAAMAGIVDRIRIMAYDYSPSEPGGIAPIDWVTTSLTAAVEVTGTPEKLVLGIPLYGYNFVTSTVGVCPADSETGRTLVTQRSLAELITKRAAVPVYDPTTDEWTFSYTLELGDGTTTCTQQRTVQYVDEAGSRARVRLAADAGIGGVALWALGYEAASWWSGEPTRG